MDLKLGQIILYSHHKENVAQFFGGLFDMDIIPVGEGVKLVHPDFQLVVIKASEKNSSERFPASLVLDFSVESEDELIALHQKIQFLSYRHQFNFRPTNEGSIQRHGQIHTFLLSDPDGRKWKFSYKEDTREASSPR